MVKKAEGVIIIFLQKKSPYSLSIFGFKWHQQKVVCPVWDEKKKTSTETETHKRNIVFMSSSQPVPVSPFIFPTVRWRVEEMRRSERWKELHQKSTKWYSFSEFVCLTGEGGEGGGSCFILLLLDPFYTTKEEKEVQNLMLGHRLYIKDEHGFHVQQGASPLVVKRPVWRQSWRG